MLCDLYSIVKLNGWESNQVSGMEMTLKNFGDMEKVYYKVIDNVNKHKDLMARPIALLQ